MKDEIRAGIYRHYRGALYLVLGLAHDANADTLYVKEQVHFVDPSGTAVSWNALGERTVVVYVPLQLDEAHLGPRMAVRTLEDFTAWVDVPGQNEDFSTCVDSVPRFDYLGPELEQWMLR